MELLAASIRHRYHACRIGYRDAMYRLMVLGVAADKADKYLRALGEV